MDENKKDSIGLRIHDRLISSVRYQQKLRLIRTVMSAAILLCVFSMTLYYFHAKDSLRQTNVHKGNNLTADFRAGYLSLDGQDSIKLTDLAKGSINLPVEVREEDGLMVVHTVRGQFTEKDSVHINVQKGGFYKIILDDGSSVYLNSDSKITYAGNFLDNRKVYIEGEAYFEVAKVEKKGVLQPFIVNTQNQEIEVLGTSFNVSAYKDKAEETTLVQGKVRLNQKETSQSIDLNPDMKATITKGQDIQVIKVDTELYSAWKDGFFYYDDMRLVNILEDLRRYYEVDFVKSEVPDIRYTLYLNRKLPFSEIIASIEKSSNILINLEHKTMKFSTKKK